MAHCATSINHIKIIQVIQVGLKIDLLDRARYYQKEAPALRLQAMLMARAIASSIANLPNISALAGIWLY